MGKILIVDDELQIVDIVEKFLKKNGFQVFATTDGTKALELLRAGERFDAMVIDINMPKITGIEVLVEKRKIGNTVPAIILSGSLGDNESLETLSELGYSEEDILYKPIDLNELLNKLRSILPGG